ncbi:MAG: hypothetical protein NTZ26_00245 [Candidatus Aminicenantes bacterium]|nr:hypothetical protein [Candidatus Aminicenantes bacterium]
MIEIRGDSLPQVFCGYGRIEEDDMECVRFSIVLNLHGDSSLIIIHIDGDDNDLPRLFDEDGPDFLCFETPSVPVAVVYRFDLRLPTALLGGTPLALANCRSDFLEQKSASPAVAFGVFCQPDGLFPIHGFPYKETAGTGGTLNSGLDFFKVSSHEGARVGLSAGFELSEPDGPVDIPGGGF